MGDHRLGHKTYDMSLKHLIVKTYKDNYEAVQDPRGHVKGTQPPWSSSQEPKTAMTLNCNGLEHTYQVCANQAFIVYSVTRTTPVGDWQRGRAQGLLCLFYTDQPSSKRNNWWEEVSLCGERQLISTEETRTLECYLQPLKESWLYP